MAMGLGNILNGSALLHIKAVSPMHNATAGSSNASNFARFTWGTMILNAGSVSLGVTAHIKRAGTSNGTFGDTGASIGVGAACAGLFVRSFDINSSATWHRVDYSNGTGSANYSVTLVLGGARIVPVDQDNGGIGGTTVYSDVYGN